MASANAQSVIFTSIVRSSSGIMERSKPEANGRLGRLIGTQERDVACPAVFSEDPAAFGRHRDTGSLTLNRPLASEPGQKFRIQFRMPGKSTRQQTTSCDKLGILRKHFQASVGKIPSWPEIARGARDIAAG